MNYNAAPQKAHAEDLRLANPANQGESPGVKVAKAAQRAPEHLLREMTQAWPGPKWSQNQEQI